MKLSSINNRCCSKCKRQLHHGTTHVCRPNDEDTTLDQQAQAHDANLLNVAQQMPDRSYDAKRGTLGHLMGEPSPGRSF